MNGADGSALMAAEVAFGADNGSIAALWAAKLAGAAAGSAISVAYLLPRGRQEAGARFMIGIVTGLVFGAPSGVAIAERLGLADKIEPMELAVMGSAAASLCAWWALGILSRFAATLFAAKPENAR